uniref:Lytic transglycosylase domain-containing protein n=1 Tax=Yoonia rhodophyticola TaxID=3137370 RepID=A0AAN0NLD1_9RHOB
MRLLSIVAAALLTAETARAQAVDPSAVAVIRAADDSWEDARILAAQADPLTRDVLTWMRLRAGEGRLAEYTSFLETHADWPGLSRLRAAGEGALHETTDAEAVIAFFGDATPQTGEGAVHLARALISTGAPEAAEAMLREVWIGNRLSGDGHAALIAAFPDILKPFHLARTDALLWRWRTSDAARMLPCYRRINALWLQRASPISRRRVILPPRSTRCLPICARIPGWPMTGTTGWPTGGGGPKRSRYCWTGPQVRRHWPNPFAGPAGAGHWPVGKCAKDGQIRLMRWPRVTI